MGGGALQLIARQILQHGDPLQDAGEQPLLEPAVETALDEAVLSDARRQDPREVFHVGGRQGRLVSQEKGCLRAAEPSRPVEIPNPAMVIGILHEPLSLGAQGEVPHLDDAGLDSPRRSPGAEREARFGEDG